MQDHDTQIIARVRSGDAEALAQFVQSNRESLLGFIRKRIGSQLQKKIEPEDVLQEASLEAVAALNKMDKGAWDPLPWLYQICERKIIDAHRRYFTTQKRAAAREAALPTADQTGGGLANLLVASMTTPSRAFSRDQNQLQMLAALDTLPDEPREALRLRYLIGLPSKEVARKMGKSDGAVRVMLTRALTRLNEMLTG